MSKRYYDAACNWWVEEDGSKTEGPPIVPLPDHLLYPKKSGLRPEPFIVGVLTAILFLVVFIYYAETTLPELKDIQLLAVLAAAVIGQIAGLFTAGVIKLLDL